MNNDPEEVSVRFTDMAYGGDAVGRARGDGVEGIAVFGWGGITGEDAVVSVTSRRRNMLRGTVSRVVEASPLRIQPPCPYFGPCGGCQWQQIDYDGQVRFKGDVLRAQLSRIGGVPPAELDAAVREPAPSPRPFGYRNTSHFAIEPGSLKLGYFKRESHSILAVDHCPISNEGVNRGIPLVNGLIARSLATEGEVPGEKGIMRLWNVAIRSSEATGQTLVVLYTEPGGQAVDRPGRGRVSRPETRRPAEPERPDQGPTAELAAEAHPSVSLRRRDIKRAISELARSGRQQGAEPALTVVEVMGDGTINLLAATQAAARVSGEALAELATGSLLAPGGPGADQAAPPLGAWVEELGGRSYWVAPPAFFQVNSAAAGLLLEEVAAHLPRRMSTLVDAHAGVGTFALAFAGRAGQVIGFETDGSAVHSAQWTAGVHRVSNLEYRHGRAEHLLRTLSADVRPDAILLDPPRSGCHPDLLAEVRRRAIPLVVYVSCDPSSLARDIKLLAPDYRLTSARVIDMFPQTYHLETVAILERGQG